MDSGFKPVTPGGMKDRVFLKFKYKGLTLILYKDEYDKMPDFSKSRSIGDGEIDYNELDAWAEKEWRKIK